MSDDTLLTSLLTAVEAAPDDIPLRVHVAEQLATRGRMTDALRHCTEAVTRAPGDPTALALLQRLSGALAGADPSSGPRASASPVGAAPTAPEHVSGPPRPEPPDAPATEFDWTSAEDEVADIGGMPERVPHQEIGGPPVEDIERPTVRLADVGGMEKVKERLELAFLGPMRNPAMAKAFGKSLSGGLLLYGPPGCGKTFLARAIAGEMGASFFNIGISDVLEMWTGASERNVTEIFRAARRNAPCVLFLDEVDALGRRRSDLTHQGQARNVVNQLLAEMDSADKDNDGVFVLGATNHPWDLDSALRRPGRFDRMLLVLPPDAPARKAVLSYHLRDRPVEKLDLDRIVKATEHFSGADLAHLCNTAAEQALAESMRSGRLHPLTTERLLTAQREIKPSTGPWFATARNVVTFANTDGSYDELAVYLKKHRQL
jgi:AAA+ superfamily predicted ATPase